MGEAIAFLGIILALVLAAVYQLRQSKAAGKTEQLQADQQESLDTISKARVEAEKVEKDPNERKKIRDEFDEGEPL